MTTRSGLLGSGAIDGSESLERSLPASVGSVFDTVGSITVVFAGSAPGGGVTSLARAGRETGPVSGGELLTAGGAARADAAAAAISDAAPTAASAIRCRHGPLVA